jgi:lipopolysaccharide heptosyltransferase II
LKKILIVNPFGIGDILFTTPVIRAIKDTYPEAFIGYWCNERVACLLRSNPRINVVFALSRGDIKKIYKKSRLEGIRQSLGLLLKIKKEKFDTCIDLSLEHYYSLIVKLLGIKKRIGFNYKNRGRFLTDKIDLDGYNSKHVVEYYLELLGSIGIKPKTSNLDLSVSEASKAKCRNLFKYYGVSDKDLIIGIAPGAGGSWGRDASIKHWPAIKFAQLAKRIIEDLKAKLLILGDESERPIADIIVNIIQHRAIDLVGKTTLEELAAVISSLNLLATNDGGPLHIAVTLGVKTVSLFGPVSELVYGPYPQDDKRHIVLKSNIDCRPCYRNFRLDPCQRNKECLEMINVEEVLDAVRRLI